MKKLAVMILAAVMLCSCGGGSEQSNKSTDGKIQLKIAAWNIAAKSLGDVAKLYEKQHPNITIEVIEVDDSYTKLITQLAAGQGAPDIFTLQLRDVQSFIGKFEGQLLDLTDRFEKDALKPRFNPAAVSMVSKDNSIFAFPWDMGPVGLYYRGDMFDKAGITEKDMETYDDFIAAGKKVQKANPGVQMLDILHLFPILFNQAGGSYIKNGKINIDSPEAKKAYDLIRKMDNENIVLKSSDWNSRIVALNNNKAASIIYPVWYAGTFRTSLADQKGLWKITEIPAFEKGGNRRANLGGSALAIATQSANSEAAYNFIKFALTTPQSEDIMMSYGLFPAYMPYYKTDGFKMQSEYFNCDINSYFARLSEGIPPIEYGAVMLDSVKPLNDLTAAVISGEDIQTKITETAQAIQRITKLEVQKY